MGTTWCVKFAASVDERLVRENVDDVLARINDQMSTWRADSDITRFNESAPGSWHELKDEFYTVLDCALALAETTDGAYDPTVGALVDLWGFGPLGRTGRLPSAEDIAAARVKAGHRRLHFDRAGRRVRQPGELRLDLSSVAKGFAVDQICERLVAMDAPDHLVEIGGELRGGGVKPDGMPWWVALETPASTSSETVVALHGLAVATSGDGQRNYDVAGRRYAHTIDPRTGIPLTNDMASVSVLHQSCMHVDALATAITVLGPTQGFGYAADRDIAALLTWRRGGQFLERMTPALVRLLQ